MYFDFLNILSLLTIFAGVVSLVDIIWRAVKRRRLGERKEKSKDIKHPVIIEYARSFFPVLLIVLLIRAFWVQPYRVPTGSLEPTIMPGDMILVNQYDYGLHLPLWNAEFIHVGHPKVGQIALFRWPVNPAVTFVKRVVGVPGDHISYINKGLYINGKEVKQTLLGDAKEIGDDGQAVDAKEYEENLNGVKHFIFLLPDRPSEDFMDVVVPTGEYFMMGDNRDNSDDSRSWGFVPDKNFVGKALFIWMSWDSEKHRVRWDRIGKKLQ